MNSAKSSILDSVLKSILLSLLVRADLSRVMGFNEADYCNAGCQLSDDVFVYSRLGAEVVHQQCPYLHILTRDKRKPESAMENVRATNDLDSPLHRRTLEGYAI